MDSEPGKDELVFKVDGRDVHEHIISGQRDWAFVEYGLPPGVRTLTWAYRKDGAENVGADAGWLDKVAVETNPPLGEGILLEALPPAQGDTFWTLRCVAIPGRFYQLKAREKREGARWKPGTETAVCATGSRVEYRVPDAYYHRNEHRVELVEPPSFKTFPQDRANAVLGKPFTLKVEADGTPDIRYQWYRIPERVDAAGAKPVKIEGETRPTITLASPSLNSAGAYYAVATNPAGSEDSPVCAVAVRVPPRVLRVESQPQDAELAQGADGKLVVDAEGELPLTYQWFKDDQAVPGATGRELTIPSAGATHAGRYVVAVKNSWGEYRSEPKPIRVLLTPSIVSAPKDLVTFTGDHVLLQVEAQGEKPFAYRWYKDGQEIPKATGASHTCDTTTAGKAVYRVGVNNKLNVAAMSDEVWVDVVVPEKARVSDLGLELVPVRAGLLMMGSPPGRVEDDEQPQREVRISEAFWIGTTEVTRGQWTVIFPEAEGNAAAGVLALQPQPVSYAEAEEFCRRLTKRERDAQRLDAKHEYALPTEAQWEHACRQGGDAAPLAEHAWYYDGDEAGGGIRAVGKKKASALGTYDMLGNAWEWTADWYAPRYDAQVYLDPTGPKQGERRVLRGGSVNSPSASCRPTARYFDEPQKRKPTYGFRVIMRKARPSPEGFRLGIGGDAGGGEAKEPATRPVGHDAGNGAMPQ